MAIEKDIGKKVRWIRKMRRMSQEELATLAELDRSYISEVENGHKNFSIKTLEKIAEALNVDIIDLLPPRTGCGKDVDR